MRAFILVADEIDFPRIGCQWHGHPIGYGLKRFFVAFVNVQQNNVGGPFPGGVVVITPAFPRVLGNEYASVVSRQIADDFR